jgi:hypothetical protein
VFRSSRNVGLAHIAVQERPANTQLVATKSAARHFGKVPMSLNTVCNTLAKLLTRDEARRIVANVAKLAKLLRR